MASPGASSLHGIGWLFGVAIVTSMLWYVFWMVMAPVKADISPLVNWYFFMKLSLWCEWDVYGALEIIHNWLPLLVFTALLLSKVARNYLIIVSQLVYVLVIIYNSVLVVLMVYAGWKVLQLFTVTLPLYLLLHCGPVLSYLFSPLTLWLPTALSLLLYYWFCRHFLTADKRDVLGAIKRVTATLLPPVLLTALTFWVMERGCLPCSTSDASTPLKPLLIGHRGCAFDSPENSLAAFEGALQHSALVGLETDVFVSMDGVLYLHHDPSLVRTTDVCSKCPTYNPFANSTLLGYYNGSCPLSKLNVGTSFLSSSKAALSAEQVVVFHSQHIPTFGQFLDIAAKNGKIVIFDVGEPPVGHPYHHTYLNRTLDAVLASGVAQDKVWWTPVGRRQWVHKTHPHLVITTKTEDTPYKDLKTEHIKKINDDWTTPLATFRQYQRDNLSINMFFVDSPFMYRYAWCIGIQTITTSNCKHLATVDTNPFLQMCGAWRDGLNSSHWTLVSGVLLFSLEVILLVGWETLRITGSHPSAITR